MQNANSKNFKLQLSYIKFLLQVMQKFIWVWVKICNFSINPASVIPMTHILFRLGSRTDIMTFPGQICCYNLELTVPLQVNYFLRVHCSPKISNTPPYVTTCISFLSFCIHNFNKTYITFCSYFRYHMQKKFFFALNCIKSMHLFCAIWILVLFIAGFFSKAHKSSQAFSF